MSRKIVILTAQLESATPKTAINLLRYRPGEIVAVVDAHHHGKTCEELFGIGGATPVFGSLESVSEADTLMLGTAPAGGKLPLEMKTVILDALRRGMKVVSGLHDFLSQDPELAAAAQRHGAVIHDVRQNDERDVAQRQGIDERCLRIHTVGHDCNVGKMVVSLELARALQAFGHRAKFVATGQTGIMIEGDGCPVDAVVVDFINGAAEKLVLRNQHQEILLIEGQGSIVHPRYSAVTLGLLHGCMPDGLILCYEVGRRTIAGMAQVALPPLAAFIQLYETMANTMHPCRVIGVAMNSRRVTPGEAADERKRVRDELGLPVCDVLRDGPDELVRAIKNLKFDLGK
jgi:uncharacterized NAD-dependent epimerase/dehydratase family protein